jgi:hypothetical protein
MDYDPDEYQQKRQTFLALFLAFFLAAGALTFMVVITGGLFLYIVPIIVGIAFYAGFHYLLWGRSFSQQTEGEREEQAAKDAAEEWAQDEPYR